MTHQHEHFVQFYEDDAFLMNDVAAFVGGGLKTGEACVVIATAAHRALLETALASGLAHRRVTAASRRGAAAAPMAYASHALLTGPYIALDAEETLASFMKDGWPDEALFRAALDPVIAKAALAGNGRVRAFGEMVALLWERGARDAALRLEDLWNGLTCRHEFPARSFSLLCAYPLRAFGSREDARRLAAVCEAHDHVRPTARRAHGEARKPGRPRHILVVDDNADAAESLAECLRVMDHSVAVARDGASAIQHALLDSPDLVILDIGLPEMDGYEVARRLRALPQLRSAVFVALTGYAERGDVERALRSGFDHHFAKPLDLPKLAALIGTPRPRKRAGGSARVSVQ